MSGSIESAVELNAVRHEMQEAERGLAAGTEAARSRYARAIHELEVAERRAWRLSLESRWRPRSWRTADS
ncbi:MAG: hypothetical protein L0Y66_03770 [Myxococcaceae bacterium]|nr:hypothetical protein [Myxococcaceae bacterium]MCI0669843.1 hypothetical protein [Myxococcaceae bacterium]